jgi:hypothetical protein
MKSGTGWPLRWLQWIREQSLGWAACRAGDFAKYNIDSEHAVRYTERVLRRRISKSLRAIGS